MKAAYYQTLLLTLILMLISCSSPKEESGPISIIPIPNTIETTDCQFRLTDKISISNSNDLQLKAISLLQNSLSSVGVTSSVDPESGAVQFIEDKAIPQEAYKLDVTRDNITIKASSEAGYIYGVQSLSQLISEDHIAGISIEDKPRFEWRGAHMDFSRHFFSVEEVKIFLDQMVYYKLNKFHMHLTDDQGWRVEIKKYPELTTKGAWRDLNNQDSICINRSKNEPYFEIEPNNIRESDGKYGGFFTQEQIKDIIKYADDRAIEVIPEIDMPGHLKAAIDNYPFLSCDDQAAWGAIFSTPACLGKETTYEFAKNILSEIAQLFPSKQIHIGGDEVNIKSWEDCSKCQAEIKKHNLKNEHHLQSHFNIKIEKYLNSIGKEMIGWDEIIEGGATKEATIMWWRNWVPSALKKAAVNGNKIVITPTTIFYFDHENGGDVESVYNKEPIPSDFTAEQEANVLGIQACHWSEWIPNFTRLQYQSFPRLLALAETAWSKKEDKDLSSFSQRLDRHLDRFDALDIMYELPPVKGVTEKMPIVDSLEVTLEVITENTEIRYTTDGSVPTTASPLYTKPLKFYDNTTLKVVPVRKGKIGKIQTADLTKISSFQKAVDLDNPKKGIKRWVEKDTRRDVAEMGVPRNSKFTILKDIKTSDYNGKKDYTIYFKGYIKIEEDGVYQFRTHDSQGTALYVDNKFVVGYQSNWYVKNLVGLKKGFHPIYIKMHGAKEGRRFSLQVKPVNKAPLKLKEIIYY